MSQEVSVTQEIQDRLEFCLILAFLCGCGFLAWQQLFFLLLMLFFGGTSAALVGLDNITQDKFNELDSLQEEELAEKIEILRQAQEILSKYKGSISENKKVANSIQNKIDNGVYEASYKLKRKQNVRKSNNHSYGAPPDPLTNQCPVGYPIRVTENLSKDDSYRGIYYCPGDRHYQATAAWCFKTENEALHEGYRRPKRS
ncbi:hypothetical protein [Spirulina major]|uniref:hypothetical protein n=1 Tax=Spirulina major TaxID=270636 RepID=UPI001114DB91|nr:hypothetical protein [Spirulina major]